LYDLINVPATLIELAGLEIPWTFEASSLTQLLDGTAGARPPEYVFMEAGYREQTQLTVRHGAWKLIHVRDEADLRLMAGTPYELYDVRADPAERNNVAHEHPELVARLGRVLRDWYAGGPQWLERGEEVDLRTLSPEEQKMLRSLGYIN
jgi:arylsulfatase A-like enzyme